MTNAKEKARVEKEHRAKVRACFELELTHIRCGDWRGTKGSHIEYVGHVRDLHGSICTDCPSSPNYQKEMP